MIVRIFHICVLWSFLELCFCFSQLSYQHSRTSPKRALIRRRTSLNVSNHANIESNKYNTAEEVIHSFLSVLNGSNYENCDEISDLIEFVDTTKCKPILSSKNLDSSDFRRLASIDDQQCHFIMDDIVIECCQLDPKQLNAGIAYHLSPVNIVSEEKYIIGRGILLLEIIDHKIISIFDVKEKIKPNKSIDRILGLNHTISGYWTGKTSSQSRDHYGITKNLIHKLHGKNNPVAKFFEARNNRDIESLQNLIDEKSSLGGFRKEEYIKMVRRIPISAKMEIEEMIFSEADHDDEFDKVFVKWYMEKHGVKLKFSRGCSFYKIRQGRITYGVDLLESEKKEVQLELNVSDQILNHLRDSGMGRFIADSLVFFGIPSIVKNNWSSVQTFFKLTKMKLNVQYGKHPSQAIDLFVPSKPKGLIFFVHGGAWGSGMPWMYRLVADPFLNLDLAVAIVGYRTYPDGSVQDQVDDLEAAIHCLSNKFPHLVQGTTDGSECEWQGISLIGHSSGAQFSMLMISQRIVSSITNQISSNVTLFDNVICLSGVFSISDHYQHESSRGVEELSPMKPACGYTLDNMDFYSPSLRLSTVPRGSLKYVTSPKIFILHGLEDDTVPFTSSRKGAKLMRAWGLTSIYDAYLHDVDHTGIIFDIMFGGKSKNTIIDCLTIGRCP